MIRSHRLYLTIGIAVLLSGCASSGQPRADEPLRLPERFSIRFRDDAPRHEAVFNAPADSVWKLLPVVYQQLGYVAAPATNTRERLFITPHFLIRNRLYEDELNSAYFDCGMGIAGHRADAYQVSFAIVARVTASAPNETLLEVAIDGNARDRATNASTVPCSGTGKLEREIAELVRRELNS